MKLHTNSNRKMPLAHSLIAAGPAAEVGEGLDLLDINELVTGGRDGFSAYEITGDSAAPEIQPGYLVFVNNCIEPRHGQFVAAIVNGLTCVKVFQHSTRGLYLVSKNAKYEPRQINADDRFHVLGGVVGHLAIYR